MKLSPIFFVVAMLFLVDSGTSFRAHRLVDAGLSLAEALIFGALLFLARKMEGRR